MKTTEGPDETFFHTIILNSERRNNVYEYDKFVKWLETRKEGEIFEPHFSSLRYMDWSESAKSKPAVLTEEYFDTLAANHNLFARKFDEKESAGLLNLIDKDLLKVGRGL